MYLLSNFEGDFINKAKLIYIYMNNSQKVNSNLVGCFQARFFPISKKLFHKTDNVFSQAHVEEIAGIVWCTFKNT